MAAGVMHIPWYATVFRGDKVAAALVEIAPVALRYGATDYAVYRSRDDRYGTYSPSPGVVYPTLTHLEEARLFAVGKRRRHQKALLDHRGGRAVPGRQQGARRRDLHPDGGSEPQLGRRPGAGDPAGNAQFGDGSVDPSRQRSAGCRTSAQITEALDRVAGEVERS